MEIAGEKKQTKKPFASKSISERPQFTCFVGGLKIALSKSGGFDPHEVNEKGNNTQRE